MESSQNLILHWKEKYPSIETRRVFFKDKQWCHSVDKVNVNIQTSWRYVWLCSPQLFTFMHVLEVMPLVTLCCLTRSISGGCDSQIVYEVCSDLSQSRGDAWLGDQSHSAEKWVFSWHLLHHYSIDLPAFPAGTFLSWDKFMVVCAAGLYTPLPDTSLMHFL